MLNCRSLDVHFDTFELTYVCLKSIGLFYIGLNCISIFANKDADTFLYFRQPIKVENVVINNHGTGGPSDGW